ncbi:precorrin-6A/cobalt-precorrin-6A reductase [Bradyrhizobium betae]
MRALILGGTADASLLAAEIARAGIDAIYSYGGRTRAPADQPLPTRIGGFGGVSRACRLHPPRRHHACDRCDASLRCRDEPHMRSPHARKPTRR